MTKFTAAAALIAAMLSPLAVLAQTPPPAPSALPPYGPGVSLEVATKMVAAAVAEARKNGWQEAVAVVDSGGRLVAFARMDNTQLSSTEIAMGKAITANGVKRPTKALQDSVAPGTSTPRMAGLPGIVAIDGAGAAANQDAEVAAAGLAVAMAK
jgi:glc operon protein GlcG